MDHVGTDDILTPPPKIQVKSVPKNRSKIQAYRYIRQGNKRRHSAIQANGMCTVKEAKGRLVIPAPRSQTRILRCERDKTCTNSAKGKLLIQSPNIRMYT